MMGTWGQGDTHGGVSNMQYGLDNWIWAMQGYNNSTVVDGGGARHQFRQGFFRFTPDGNKLEFIRPTNNNTWGSVSARKAWSLVRPPTAIRVFMCPFPIATTSRYAAGP